MLLLDLFNLLLILFMEVPHALNILEDGHLLAVHTVLVSAMEVALLPKLLPGGLGLLSNDIGLLELDFHLLDFGP